MKQLTLIVFIGVLGLPVSAAEDLTAKQVNVWGRDWIVAPIEDHPGVYSAVRQNLEHQPYRGPARTRTAQAVRAFQTATGCRPDFDSMYQIITGEFHAKLICPK